MSRTDEAMSDQDLFNEMKSVAFNRDFEKEIKEYTTFLREMKEHIEEPYVDYIEEKFRELFLVR